MTREPLGREAIAELVARSRAEQGLSPKVDDPATLARLAVILRARRGPSPAARPATAAALAFGGTRAAPGGTVAARSAANRKAPPAIATPGEAWPEVSTRHARPSTS